MRFISTRGGEKTTALDAAIKGIAANGGLFVPEKIPAVTDAELEEMLEMSYPERVAAILGKFFTELDGAGLSAALEEAYSRFGADPAPLVRADDGVYMLELFHGPTCSSKDMSVAALPYIFKKACGGKSVTVLAATSGDVGKAALELFKDRAGFKTLVFYPADGISKMQKLQLVTQEGKNVGVVAVKGSFDDCLSAVKETLLNCGDQALVTANSINFAAFAPRIAYYFSAYLDMLSSEQLAEGEEVDFFIPCGNLGNALAAFYAKLMGLPIRRIHCATNENNALCGFLKNGVFDANRELVKTTSPNMDVLIPSELERLIFEISGRDAKLTAKRMKSLAEEGTFCITENELEKINGVFDGGYATEETCVEAMYDVFTDIGYVMDTNAGCAMKVVHDWYEKNKKDETKAVIVAADSPYKFPQDVLYAMTGNDVKDSFKGVKRLHDATAMAVPKCIKELRDKPAIFTKSVDRKKLPDEIAEFLK